MIQICVCRRVSGFCFVLDDILIWILIILVVFFLFWFSFFFGVCIYMYVHTLYDDDKKKTIQFYSLLVKNGTYI